jgi:hypothetical protein
MGEVAMEKKAKRKSYRKVQKNRYCYVLEACRKIDELDQSLVNNSTNIIYNLNNINIPRWKDLSKVQKVALFFNYVVDDSWYAITLRFSNEFMANCGNNSKVTDFIRRRINENFKNKLGYVPEYMFSIEFENGVLHVHGAIKPNNDLSKIEQILKTAAFSKKRYHTLPEQFKLRRRCIYNGRGWGRYVLKTCFRSEFDIYMCDAIIRRIAQTHGEFLRKLKGFKND